LSPGCRMAEAGGAYNLRATPMTTEVTGTPLQYQCGHYHHRQCGTLHNSMPWQARSPCTEYTTHNN